MVIRAGGIEGHLAFGSNLVGYLQLIIDAAVVDGVLLALCLSGQGGHIHTVTVVVPQVVLEGEVALSGAERIAAPAE